MHEFPPPFGPVIRTLVEIGDDIAEWAPDFGWWLQQQLFGFPKGNPYALRPLGDSLAALGDLNFTNMDELSLMMQHLDPWSGDGAAMVAYQRITSHIMEMLEAGLSAIQAAEMVYGAANEIELMLWMAIIAVVMLIVVIVQAIVTAFISFGATLAEIPIETAITQSTLLAARIALTKAIRDLGMKAVVQRFGRFMWGGMSAPARILFSRALPNAYRRGLAAFSTRAGLSNLAREALPRFVRETLPRFVRQSLVAGGQRALFFTGFMAGPELVIRSFQSTLGNRKDFGWDQLGATALHSLLAGFYGGPFSVGRHGIVKEALAMGAGTVAANVTVHQGANLIMGSQWAKDHGFNRGVWDGVLQGAVFGSFMGSQGHVFGKDAMRHVLERELPAVQLHSNPTGALASALTSTAAPGRAPAVTGGRTVTVDPVRSAGSVRIDLDRPDSGPTTSGTRLGEAPRGGVQTPTRPGDDASPNGTVTHTHGADLPHRSADAPPRGQDAPANRDADTVVATPHDAEGRLRQEPDAPPPGHTDPPATHDGPAPLRDVDEAGRGAQRAHVDDGMTAADVTAHRTPDTALETPTGERPDRPDRLVASGGRALTADDPPTRLPDDIEIAAAGRQVPDLLRAQEIRAELLQEMARLRADERGLTAGLSRFGDLIERILRIPIFDNVMMGNLSGIEHAMVNARREIADEIRASRVAPVGTGPSLVHPGARTTVGSPDSPAAWVRQTLDAFRGRVTPVGTGPSLVYTGARTTVGHPDSPADAAWARRALDAFRADEGDVGDIADNLAAFWSPELRALLDQPSLRPLKDMLTELAEGWRGEAGAPLPYRLRDVFTEVRQHLLEMEHPLPGERVDQRFAPSADIAEAWIRLREGRWLGDLTHERLKLLERDVTLVLHELMEARLRREGMPHDDAHDAASRRWNWEPPAPTGENLHTMWPPEGRSRGDSGVAADDVQGRRPSGVHPRTDPSTAADVPAPRLADGDAPSDAPRHPADASVPERLAAPRLSAVDLTPTGTSVGGRELYLGRDGRLHFVGDPLDTYRDGSGALHHTNGTFALDVNALPRPDVGGPAIPTDRVTTMHIDGPQPSELAESTAERVRQARDDRQVAAKRKAAIYDALDPSMVDSLRRAGVRVDRSSFGGASTRSAIERVRSKLGPSAFMQALKAAFRYGEAASDLAQASEALGIAGGAHAAAVAYPGAITVTGGEGHSPGNTFDRVLLIDSEPPRLIIMEEKGAGSWLETRRVDFPIPGMLAEQGSAAYVRHLLQHDQNLAAALARDPVLRAKVEAAVRAGDIVSVVAHASERGVVTLTEYHLDPVHLAHESIQLATLNRAAAGEGDVIHSSVPPGAVAPSVAPTPEHRMEIYHEVSLRVHEVGDLAGWTVRAIESGPDHLSYELTRDDVTIRVDITQDALPADKNARSTMDHDAGHYTIRISDQLATEHVQRHLAHELGELLTSRSRYLQHQQGTAPVHPGPPVLERGSTIGPLTPEDAGRVMELRVLAKRVADLEAAVAHDPARLKDLREEISEARILVEHLGLRDGEPGSQERRALIADDTIDPTGQGRDVEAVHRLIGELGRADAGPPDHGVHTVHGEAAVRLVQQEVRAVASGFDLTGSHVGLLRAASVPAERGVTMIFLSAVSPDGYVVIGRSRLTVHDLAEGLAELQRDGRLPPGELRLVTEVGTTGAHTVALSGPSTPPAAVIAMRLETVVTASTDGVAVRDDGTLELVAGANGEAGRWISYGRHGHEVATPWRMTDLGAYRDALGVPLSGVDRAGGDPYLTYRGQDGLLHVYGDPPFTWRDANLQLHHLHDQVGTYRDSAFVLRNLDGQRVASLIESMPPRYRFDPHVPSQRYQPQQPPRELLESQRRFAELEHELGSAVDRLALGIERSRGLDPTTARRMAEDAGQVEALARGGDAVAADARAILDRKAWRLTEVQKQRQIVAMDVLTSRYGPGPYAVLLDGGRPAGLAAGAIVAFDRTRHRLVVIETHPPTGVPHMLPDGTMTERGTVPYLRDILRNSPDLHRALTENRAVRDELHRALSRGTLTVHYHWVESTGTGSAPAFTVHDLRIDTPGLLLSGVAERLPAPSGDSDTRSPGRVRASLSRLASVLPHTDGLLAMTEISVVNDPRAGWPALDVKPARSRPFHLVVETDLTLDAPFSYTYDATTRTHRLSVSESWVARLDDAAVDRLLARGIGFAAAEVQVQRNTFLSRLFGRGLGRVGTSDVLVFEGVPGRIRLSANDLGRLGEWEGLARLHEHLTQRLAQPEGHTPEEIAAHRRQTAQQMYAVEMELRQIIETHGLRDGLPGAAERLALAKTRLSAEAGALLTEHAAAWRDSNPVEAVARKLILEGVLDRVARVSPVAGRSKPYIFLHPEGWEPRRGKGPLSVLVRTGHVDPTAPNRTPHTLPDIFPTVGHVRVGMTHLTRQFEIVVDPRALGDAVQDGRLRGVDLREWTAQVPEVARLQRELSTAIARTIEVMDVRPPDVAAVRWFEWLILFPLPGVAGVSVASVAAWLGRNFPLAARNLVAHAINAATRGLVYRKLTLAQATEAHARALAQLAERWHPELAEDVVDRGFILTRAMAEKLHLPDLVVRRAEVTPWPVVDAHRVDDDAARALRKRVGEAVLEIGAKAKQEHEDRREQARTERAEAEAAERERRRAARRGEAPPEVTEIPRLQQRADLRGVTKWTRGRFTNPDKFLLLVERHGPRGFSPFHVGIEVVSVDRTKTAGEIDVVRTNAHTRLHVPPELATATPDAFRAAVKRALDKVAHDQYDVGHDEPGLRAHMERAGWESLYSGGTNVGGTIGLALGTTDVKSAIFFGAGLAASGSVGALVRSFTNWYLGVRSQILLDRRDFDTYDHSLRRSFRGRQMLTRAVSDLILNGTDVAARLSQELGVPAGTASGHLAGVGHAELVRRFNAGEPHKAVREALEAIDAGHGRRFSVRKKAIFEEVPIEKWGGRVPPGQDMVLHSDQRGSRRDVWVFVRFRDFAPSDKVDADGVPVPGYVDQRVIRTQDVGAIPGRGRIIVDINIRATSEQITQATTRLLDVILYDREYRLSPSRRFWEVFVPIAVPGLLVLPIGFAGFLAAGAAAGMGAVFAGAAALLFSAGGAVWNGARRWAELVLRTEVHDHELVNYLYRSMPEDISPQALLEQLRRQRVIVEGIEKMISSMEEALLRDPRTAPWVQELRDRMGTLPSPTDDLVPRADNLVSRVVTQLDAVVQGLKDSGRLPADLIVKPRRYTPYLEAWFPSRRYEMASFEIRPGDTGGEPLLARRVDSNVSFVLRVDPSLSDQQIAREVGEWLVRRVEASRHEPTGVVSQRTRLSNLWADGGGAAIGDLVRGGLIMTADLHGLPGTPAYSVARIALEALWGGHGLAGGLAKWWADGRTDLQQAPYDRVFKETYYDSFFHPTQELLATVAEDASSLVLRTHLAYERLWQLRQIAQRLASADPALAPLVGSSLDHLFQTRIGSVAKGAAVASFRAPPTLQPFLPVGGPAGASVPLSDVAVMLTFDRSPGQEQANLDALAGRIARGRPVFVGFQPPASGTRLPYGLSPDQPYEVVRVGGGVVELRDPLGLNHPAPVPQREFLEMVLDQYVAALDGRLDVP